MKLAELLLRRKELQDRLSRMKPLDQRELFETTVQRRNVMDSIDDVIASVSQVTWKEFEKERNEMSRKLRLVDAAIQQANWTTEIEGVDPSVMDG